MVYRRRGGLGPRVSVCGPAHGWLVPLFRGLWEAEQPHGRAGKSTVAHLRVRETERCERHHALQRPLGGPVPSNQAPPHMSVNHECEWINPMTRSEPSSHSCVSGVGSTLEDQAFWGCTSY